MKKLHNDIEDVLNRLHKSIRDFNNDANRLYEMSAIEESTDPLYDHINELIILQLKVSELILGVLSDDYLPQPVKKNLIHTQTLRLVDDASKAYSPLAKLVEKLEKN